MAMIDWSRCDDYQFVKLVGDLLVHLGFVDTDYQGDGPDGGIDIFATELLPFTMQGRTPFRWAVQCKFSIKGGDACVNDHEIRDVEGILRSDRYQAQDPRGYMLVTNRRIAQNVIERLRGIDRSSQYRTARVDLKHLESLLTEFPELIERYFGDPLGLTVRLGSPVVIAVPENRSFKVAAPIVKIRIRPLGGQDGFIQAKAIVDTGASLCVIPRAIADELQLKPHNTRSVRVFDGPTKDLFVVFAEIAIENAEFERVEAVTADVSRAILGQSILERYTVLIDPDGTVSMYKTKK